MCNPDSRQIEIAANAALSAVTRGCANGVEWIDARPRDLCRITLVIGRTIYLCLGNDSVGFSVAMIAQLVTQ